MRSLGDRLRKLDEDTGARELTLKKLEFWSPVYAVALVGLVVTAVVTAIRGQLLVAAGLLLAALLWLPSVRYGLSLRRQRDTAGDKWRPPY